MRIAIPRAVYGRFSRSAGEFRPPRAHCHAPPHSLFTRAKAGHCGGTLPRNAGFWAAVSHKRQTRFWRKPMSHRITRRGVNAGIGATLISPALVKTPAFAQGAAPIKIGFSMALTGPLAANGKQALLGTQIWQDEVNAKGGLLGRQVQLVNYDDQSNPSTVPGIYTKLLDVDKVDLVVGPYATNMVAPAIPVVMQKNK